MQKRRPVPSIGCYRTEMIMMDICYRLSHGLKINLEHLNVKMVPLVNGIIINNYYGPILSPCGTPIREFTIIDIGSSSVFIPTFLLLEA